MRRGHGRWNDRDRVQGGATSENSAASRCLQARPSAPLPLLGPLHMCRVNPDPETAWLSGHRVAKPGREARACQVSPSIRFALPGGPSVDRMRIAWLEGRARPKGMARAFARAGSRPRAPRTTPDRRNRLLGAKRAEKLNPVQPFRDFCELHRPQATGPAGVGILHSNYAAPFRRPIPFPGWLQLRPGCDWRGSSFL